MSVSNLPDGAVAALTAKELEILRLLAGGHTVKSIAVQLGRSEASINERLRDARRKTCTGSSRELARLLDAQKIWDKEIDLAGQRSATKTVALPRGVGRHWSKGLIMTVLAMPLAAIGLVLATASPVQESATSQTAQAAAASHSPLAGTWQLDVERIPADERPRRVTIRFGLEADQKWTVHVEMVGPDGASRVAESTAATDGVPVAIRGNMAFIDSASLRQPAPDTLVMTLGKNGAPVSTRVYSVSGDHKTMIETIIWSGQEIPKLETTYFKRVD